MPSQKMMTIACVEVKVVYNADLRLNILGLVS